jgi:hypothetical protein
VGAAAVVPGVLAQLEEVEDVVVPGLEVGTAGAPALAALVDRDELVVVQLEEGDDALAFAVGALDVAPGAADAVHEPPRPPAHLERKAFSAMPRMHDALDGVVDLVEVAGLESWLCRVPELNRVGVD